MGKGLAAGTEWAEATPQVPTTALLVYLRERMHG